MNENILKWVKVGIMFHAIINSNIGFTPKTTFKKHYLPLEKEPETLIFIYSMCFSAQKTWSELFLKICG